MTPILSVQNLRVSFCGQKGQRITAVEDVSFDLMPGEVLGIVGESGSGKSVTGQAILRLLPGNGRIEAGQMRLYPGTERALDTAQLRPNSRRANGLRGKDVAMIFQEPMAALSPVHTIGAQITETLRRHHRISAAEARARAIDLLTQVQIPLPEQRIDQYSFELSGGLRQRAMIAIALAGDPAILIADEPTTALDVTTQAQILRLLRQIQAARQMSVIFISHDLGVIAQLADRVVVMRRGRVVETGAVRQIFAAPQQDYTRTLLASVQRLEQPVAATPQSQRADDPILRVRGLSVDFDLPRGMFAPKAQFRALSGVDLDIRRGETLALVGESGSGKTTLGRAILRAIDPSAGQAVFAPKGGAPVDLSRARQEDLRPLRRKMQMIFQDPFASLSPRMTVRDIIAEPYRATIGTDGLSDAVQRIAARCQIAPDWLSRYPHAFSGGQRQRIGIARALISGPELVVCDEAVSALDVTIQSDILDLLVGLQADLGLTYLFITHDMGVVRHIADRIAVMRKGEIVELGSADQVLDAPQQPYTQALIASVLRPDPALRSATLA